MYVIENWYILYTYLIWLYAFLNIHQQWGNNHPNLGCSRLVLSKHLRFQTQHNSGTRLATHFYSVRLILWPLKVKFIFCEFPVRFHLLNPISINFLVPCQLISPIPIYIYILHTYIQKHIHIRNHYHNHIYIYTHTHFLAYLAISLSTIQRALLVSLMILVSHRFLGYLI
jgi:hypothetical protein